MTKGGLNDQQRVIAETLEGSINVVAGAGTGKTFTLTRRIVNAVKQRLANNPEDEDPAGHVLAITFTNKAASELKSRVRLAFLEEASKGSELSDRYLKCALSIDNAWISTIHGMAGRILRENAIEFKIDPNFVNLTDQSESVMLSKAAENAFYQVLESDDDNLKDFVHAYKLVSTSEYESSLLDHVNTLLETVSYMPDGIEGVRTLSDFIDPVLIADDFLKEAQKISRILPLCEFKGKEAEKADKYLEDVQSGLVNLREWVDEQSESDAVGSEINQDRDIQEKTRQLLSLLSSFPATTDKFGSKTEFADDFFDYRRSLKEAFDSTLSNLMVLKDRSFLAFARLVESNLARIKSEGTTKMSQSDMLVECNRLLGMKEHESIAERYQNKFDLIMLDEFQDTDKLQMSLIGKLAKKEPPDSKNFILSNLCTVGDMQQSIYRFRGGDVEQSQIRIESLKEERGLQLELSSNYRSHKDILDAVELIFSQENVFGNEFLKLDAKCNTLDQQCIQIFEKTPRVTYDFIHGGKAEDGTKFNIDDVRKFEARRIADHFKRLIDKGAAPQDMALLLGSMKRADLYANAIRNAGIECAITTGSLFSVMPEPKLISSLLKFATNTHDDMALFQILVSKLFEISDDALLLLCKVKNDDKVQSRSLSETFMKFEGFDSLLPEQERSVKEAKDLLTAFVADARASSPSKALRSLFAKSGMLLEFQEKADAQSLVSAGTIKKAIDIVSDFENQSTGVAEVSTNYDTYLSDSKETPGTLVSSNSNFVQILSIHSSKGLEFKHVAVAALRDGISIPYPPPFNLENIDDETFFAFKPEKPDFASYREEDLYKALCKFKSLQNIEEVEDDAERPLTKYENVKLAKKEIRDASSHKSLSDALDSYCKDQTLDEARRLAYVAMTRAKESLYVSMSFKDKPSASYKGVFNDIFSAMAVHFNKPAEEFDENFSYVQMPIGANRIALASEEASQYSAETTGENETTENMPDNNSYREVPIYKDPVRLAVSSSAIAPIWEGLYSYSKLAESHPGIMLSEEDMEYFDDHRMFNDSYVDDEVLMMSQALEGSNAFNEENPTSLGSAFHRLAQISIIEANRTGSHVLNMPDNDRVAAVGKSLALSKSQIDRLSYALTLWFGSNVAKEFSQHSQMLAEVPFNVQIDLDDGSNQNFVIFGEIDGLASNDSRHAYFIDYKTGNRDESSSSYLSQKYEFQAKCYAFALLSSGFESVTATFVLVEKPVHENGGKSIEPMCIEYSFSKDDANSLKSEIIEAYQRHLENVSND